MIVPKLDVQVPITHLVFPHTISVNFSNLALARNKGSIPPSVPTCILNFQSLVHFFNNLLVIAVEPLPRDGISQGSREVMGLARSRPVVGEPGQITPNGVKMKFLGVMRAQ
jgi:hypothetical protein